jgi:hypothetical protein
MSNWSGFWRKFTTIFKSFIIRAEVSIVIKKSRNVAIAQSESNIGIPYCAMSSCTSKYLFTSALYAKPDCVTIRCAKSSSAVTVVIKKLRLELISISYFLFDWFWARR